VNESEFVEKTDVVPLVVLPVFVVTEQQVLQINQEMPLKLVPHFVETLCSAL